MKHFSLILLLIFTTPHFTIGQNNSITQEEFSLITNTVKGVKTSMSVTEKYFEHPYFTSKKSSFKTQVLKQKLDSTNEIQTSLNGTQQYSITKYEYSKEGYCTSQTIFKQNSATLQPYSFTGYTYNNSGQIVKDSLAFWDINSNQWFTEYQTEYWYTENGNPSKLIGYFKYADNDQWFPRGKEEYTYDSNENLTQLESSEYIGYYQKWFPKLLQTNEYNNLQQHITETNFKWEFNDSIWIPDNRKNYSYDANGNNTLFVHQVYLDSVFTTQFREIFSYNPSNLTTQLLYQPMSDTGWANRIKIDYSYDSYNNLTNNIWSYWYYVTQDWLKSSKDFYTYNNDYSNTELLLPPEFEYQGSYWNMLLTNGRSNWDSASATWINAILSTHYYSGQYVNSIIYPTSKEFVVYPNPVIGELYFYFPNFTGRVPIEIYDISGRLIQNSEIQNNECIDLSKQSKGIYLYKAFVNNQYYQGRVAKW